MKSPVRSPAIRRAVSRAERLGFRVEFAQYLENADNPGWLGRLAGLCDLEKKLIRVRTVHMSRSAMAAVLEHELEHAEGKEKGPDYPALGLTCGGRV